MRNLVSATLNYGAIYVPVGVATAASRNNLAFKTLHSKCGQPTKQEKFCLTCQGDKSLSSTELSKGYEIAKGQFIILDEEELSLLSAERSRMIELSKFVDVNEVVPLMIEKTYWLMPNETLSAPYDLLAATLADLGVCGVGKTALWGKETPIAIDAFNGVLSMMLLYCADELVPESDVPGNPQPVEGPALELAKMWVEMRRGSLDVDDLTSETRTRTLEYIQAKANGQALPETKPMLDPQETVDLMAELREMVSA